VRKNIIAAPQLASLHMYENPSDIWIWTASPNGTFTLSSAWNIVRLHGPSFDFVDVLWFPGHIPKMSCCILGAIHDKLPTSARLKHFNVVPHDTCVLCNSETETTSHL